jgi:uncharacterized protein YndB with AHSA1/START domain
MAPIDLSSERTIAAPAETVYGYIADMREHHPNFLPPNFSEFTVESGGTGAGTVIRFALTAGGRTRRFHSVIAEPEPGRVLTESDLDSSAVTTFTVTPADEQSCRVRIGCRWDGASGIGGFFERTFAPRAMRGILTDELNRLDDYARAQATV